MAPLTVCNWECAITLSTGQPSSPLWSILSTGVKTERMKVCDFLADPRWKEPLSPPSPALSDRKRSLSRCCLPRPGQGSALELDWFSGNSFLSFLVECQPHPQHVTSLGTARMWSVGNMPVAVTVLPHKSQHEGMPKTHYSKLWLGLRRCQNLSSLDLKYKIVWKPH